MQARSTTFRAFHLALAAALLLAMVTSNATAGTWLTVAPQRGPQTSGLRPANAPALPQAPELIVYSYDDTRLEVGLDLAGLELALEETAGGRFVKVSWPEAPLAGRYGAPALPVARRLFVAGPDAMVALKVHEGDAMAVDLAAHGFAEPVIPAQPSISMAPGMLEQASFQYDGTAYAADTPLPTERATITKLGIVRGHQLYLLEVRPVAYDPAGGKLTVWPHIEVSIGFPNGCGCDGELGSLTPLDSLVLNPPPPPGPLGPRESTYLIIVASVYDGTAPMNQFINAKTTEGYSVMTHSVAPGTSNTAIKSYIQSLWGTPDSPKHVLLVGDTDTIPSWTGGGNSHAATDLPYSCMDAGDDWYPDIPLGRFSARSTADLQSIVDKTLYVEDANFADPNYVQRAAFLATNDMSSGGEETHDFVIANYMDPAGFESTKIYARLGGGTSHIFTAFNRGCIIGVYFGHSSSSGWWTPSFDQTDVRNLTNANLYPATVLSFSCNVGRYTNTECFGETWVREVNKGSASVIFPSNYIYYTITPWHQACNLEKFFYGAVFEREIYVVSPAWHLALASLVAYYGPGEPACRDYSEMYNLLGDPSLQIPRPLGFDLIADPVSLSLCSPPTDQAVYTINVEQIQGFDDPVTLSATGEPPGSSVNFSVNPVTPPGTSVMTVSNITGGSPGEYDIEITGTAPSMQRSTFAKLNLSTTVPAAVTLTSPPDGAIDVPRQPTLVWQPSSHAIEYDLEIATDAAFANVVYSTVLTDTTHTVDNNLDSATLHYWHVRAVNGCGDSGFCDAFTFTVIDQPDYFTEQFGGGGDSFDLENVTLEFTPNVTGDYYAVCRREAAELPTDPSGGTEISLSEDRYELVTLDYSKTVKLYNLSYTSFYVCDNGYLTFNSGDTTYNESLTVHFNQPRVSALFDDLSAPAGGTISWQQLDDRAVVTYEDVPEYGTSNHNTFQIEMFFSGDIHITWLGIDANDAIVGLSQGNGLPGDYLESDLSAAPECDPIPEPPIAEDDSVSTAVNTSVTVTLTATDEGLPDPPGVLTYIIVSLPSDGTLSDPGAGNISSVPHSLVNFGNQVVYTPDLWFGGDDSFTFKANDGGTPPDGGDSNVATIAIEVSPATPQAVHSFTMDSDPGWSTEGLWAFGPPTGGGSHGRDPDAGYTGNNVYGYNLAGDYSSNMPAYYLTTAALDCRGLLDVELRFWRWLGVESSEFDHATVEVSNDGTTWTEAWTNPPASMSDTEWSQMLLDISAVADNQPTLYIRWAMGPTDVGITYPGWNIDDVEIWAVVTPPCHGDLDGDGQIGLSDLAILLANYGTTQGAHYGDGDLDFDGDVDLSDLAALLAVYGTTCG